FSALRRPCLTLSGSCSSACLLLAAAWLAAGLGTCGGFPSTRSRLAMCALAPSDAAAADPPGQVEPDRSACVLGLSGDGSRRGAPHRCRRAQLDYYSSSYPYLNFTHATVLLQCKFYICTIIYTDCYR